MLKKIELSSKWLEYTGSVAPFGYKPYLGTEQDRTHKAPAAQMSNSFHSSQGASAVTARI